MKHIVLSLVYFVHMLFPLGAIQIEPTLVMKQGTSQQLKYENPDDLELSFVSDQPKIVSVDDRGVVSALKTGKAVVRIFETSVPDIVLGSIEIKVEPEIIPVSFAFKREEFSVIRGQSLTLGYDTDAKPSEIQWTSSDATIASVENGIVSGHKNGRVTIQATVQDRSFTTTVFVYLPLQELIFNPETVTLEIGESTTIPDLIVIPYDTTANVRPTYYSTDDSVATIEGDQIVAVGKGTTTIVAKVGSIRTSLKVTVDYPKTTNGATIVVVNQGEIKNDQLVINATGAPYNEGLTRIELDKSLLTSYLDTVNEGNILITLDEMTSGLNFKHLDALILPSGVITEKPLSIHILDDRNNVLMIYHFKKAYQADLDLKMSLKEIDERHPLASKLSTQAFELFFFMPDGVPEGMSVELSARSLHSTFGQMHFLYTEENGQLQYTQQSSQVDQNDRLLLKIDHDHYIVTFTQLGVASDQMIFYILGSIIVIIISGVIFVTLKRRQSQG